MKKNKYTIVIASIFVIGFIISPMFCQATSTKLEFNAMEWLDENLVPPNPTIIFIEDGVYHIKDHWAMHALSGTIGDDYISGWTKSFLHVKLDLSTNEYVINGQTWFYITWGELTGYFTGPINMKIVYGLYGKFVIQGYEDFDGMKLSGIIWGNVETNYFAGTLLIPNP